MSNSNYNFRTEFEKIKEGKQSLISEKADVFLKKVILELNDEKKQIYKEMLDEIIFIQNASTSTYTGTNNCVKLYVKKVDSNRKKTNSEADIDLDMYFHVTDYNFTSQEEISALLKEVQSKLREENFDIMPYTGRYAAKSGNSFILKDIPR